MPSIFLPKCNKIIRIIRTTSVSLIFGLISMIKSRLFFFLIDSGEIVIAKYNYNSQDNHELTITKNERLQLLDDTCLWWKVKRVDSDETGYVYN